MEIQRKSLFIDGRQSPKNEISSKIQFFERSLDFLNRNLIGSDTRFFYIFWIPELVIQKSIENHRKSLKIQ